jgi:hypothetical protein
MPILQTAVNVLGKADLTKDIGQALNNLINGESALDVGAAAGELAASLASGVAIHGLIRPTFQGVRFGLALSGNIWKWEALTKAAGSAGGVGSGALIDWLKGLELGTKIYDATHQDPLINERYRTAITPPRRDPLAIDLDGDGIETVGIPTTGTPILFDHDADGVKTGTGWLKGDDAWLVLDRDGNGTIDSGREMFGVDTIVTRGATNSTTVSVNALDGFEALRSLDVGDGSGVFGSAAYDGVFDARDNAFTQVRLWRDLNQDGVSQANELSTLASAGITAINLAPTAVTNDLGNGNSVTGTATVVRNGSTTVVSGVNLSASNLGLASNGFYREFLPIPVTDAARALPEMGGSGWLRDLREAMSLGTTGSAALVTAVQQFAGHTGRVAFNRNSVVVQSNARH